MSENKYIKENKFLKQALQKFMRYDTGENNFNKMNFYGQKYKCDKVTHHHYDEIYDFFLSKFYDSEGSIIEIGIDAGRSLRMWLKMFTKAHIYGMDIGTSYNGDRHDIYQYDQSKKQDLQAFADMIDDSNLLFINDDGSHIPEHQLLTFNTLFPLLKQGGVYIIEDVETSYWTKNGLYGYLTRYGYRHKKSIVEIFKDCADIVNKEFIKENINSKVKHHNSIQSITFSRNCIIIVKNFNKTRNYRFAENL